MKAAELYLFVTLFVLMYNGALTLNKLFSVTIQCLGYRYTLLLLRCVP